MGLTERRERLKSVTLLSDLYVSSAAKKKCGESVSAAEWCWLDDHPLGHAFTVVDLFCPLDFDVIL